MAEAWKGIGISIKIDAFSGPKICTTPFTQKNGHFTSYNISHIYILSISPGEIELLAK